MARVYFLDFWLFLRKITLNLVVILCLLIGSGALLYLNEAWPDATFLECVINAFYIMTVECVPLPDRWYLEIMVLLLPIAALLVGAEALVGATVMFVNRRLRRGEWNKVVASTCKGHTVICGIGQLGLTLCELLHSAGRQVVAVDLDEDARGMATARGLGVPTLEGDMTVEGTLRDANVQAARYLMACSGNDLANLEAAIEAALINPDITVYARVYRASFASHINAALRQNINIFSPYSAAAEGILDEMAAANHARSQADGDTG